MTRNSLLPAVAALTVGAVVSAPLKAQPEIEIFGRAHLDYAWYDDDRVELGSGGELRRGRLGVSGPIGGGWRFKVQYDFAGGDATAKDVFLTYSGLGPGELKIGNFKQRMSLSHLTSSKYGTFMERALPTALTFGYGLGIGYTWLGSNSSIQGAIHGQDINDSGVDEGTGGHLRATWTPLRDGDRVVHIGAAVSREEPADRTDTARFRARPESHVTDVRLVDTGTLDRVDHLTRAGIEAAFVNGPWSVQGEYLRVDAARDGQDFSGAGWYVYGSWMITGESRPYQADGTFGRLRPAAESGAWEVALRYSHLDLDDAGITGGEETNTTLALNYYARPNLRFQLNLTDVQSTRAGIDDDPGIVQMRVGYDF